MKVRVGEVLQKDFLFFPIGLVLGVLLLLADFLGLAGIPRQIISFVVEPLSYSSSTFGGEVRDNLKVFVEFGEFKKEYNQMKIDMYEKDVENAFYGVLKEENDSLKKQIKMGNLEARYVLSKVLSGENVEYIRINQGSGSGIVPGDVVSLGNFYVGTVSSADENGSLVRLASNKGSNLEVVVVRGGVEENRIASDVKILSKGVVSGSSDGIKIENIAMNADVKNGDIVVVNDVKVGEYLVVGTLVGLSENPAATSRNGYVSTLVDYDDLVTVFVRIGL